MTKPIIGIVSKHFRNNSLRPNMYIRDEVKQAIFDNNAIAIGILLPKDEKNIVSDNWTYNLSEEEFNSLIEQINLCDGIIFQGGSVCDNYEMIVAKYCYDFNIPTLGLCCGQNVMVRALGGTTKRINNPEKHNSNSTYVHEINISEGTLLSKIIPKEKIMVNSRHNKTVDDHPNLIASAYCEDGYIEAVEDQSKDFYVALRFHPESLFQIDENMNAIFKYFINTCKNGKVRRRK